MRFHNSRRLGWSGSVDADLRLAGRRRRGHELADAVKDYLELGVGFLFQVGQLAAAGWSTLSPVGI